MASKLKNLIVRKVDFVDQGANPDADIKLFKRKDGSKQVDEDGRKRSSGNVLKKLLDFICKAAGMNPDEIDGAMDEITKGNSVSFREKINEVSNQKIMDEMWDICYALQSSLSSILNDDELDSAGAEKAMQESLNDFYEVAQESIKKWSSGKAAGIAKKDEELTEDDIRMMKSTVERLNESIEKAAAPASEGQAKQQTIEIEQQKGEETEMKIDKSKMTDAERAFYESLEKRYGVEDQPAGGASVVSAPATDTSAVPKVEKSATQNDTPAQRQVPTQAQVPVQPADDDGIYKGLHLAVKAELEELKKFREATEERELGQVAKKYEIIGKKPEDLVPLFKSLKAAGGTAYDDMIAVLNQAVETVEKSGVFSEIGKSGHGSSSTGAAEAKIDTIAKGYMEKDPSLSYTVAVAKAWENNPELVSEYEDEAGF